MFLKRRVLPCGQGCGKHGRKEGGSMRRVRTIFVTITVVLPGSWGVGDPDRTWRYGKGLGSQDEN